MTSSMVRVFIMVGNTSSKLGVFSIEKKDACGQWALFLSWRGAHATLGKVIFHQRQGKGGGHALPTGLSDHGA